MKVSELFHYTLCELYLQCKKVYTEVFFMPRKKKHTKLPNGYGNISYLGSGRRRPYGVYPPAPNRIEGRTIRQVRDFIGRQFICSRVLHEGAIYSPAPDAVLHVGDTVRIKGLTTIGRVESIDGKMATVIFGDMRTKMRAERLEHAEESKQQISKQEERNTNIVGAYGNASKDTRNVIDNRKLNFKQDIDVRGMRGDEAINAVTYFIDDAILVGVSRVRILHGTGTGILRQLIRQYLATIPNVSHFRDEHVQFGGAGITVVDLD